MENPYDVRTPNSTNGRCVIDLTAGGSGHFTTIKQITTLNFNSFKFLQNYQVKFNKFPPPFYAKIN